MRSRFGRGAQGHMSRERGATLVEYALVFAMLIVGSLGAIQFLTDNAKEQINNNADCVSKRPPPVECQTPAQSVPDDYEDFPPTTLYVPPASSGTAQFQSTAWNSGTGKITGTARVRAGTPATGVEGAVVYLKWTCGGATFYDTVTTDSSKDTDLTVTTRALTLSMTVLYH